MYNLESYSCIPPVLPGLLLDTFKISLRNTLLSVSRVASGATIRSFRSLTPFSPQSEGLLVIPKRIFTCVSQLEHTQLGTLRLYCQCYYSNLWSINIREMVYATTYECSATPRKGILQMISCQQRLTSSDTVSALQCCLVVVLVPNLKFRQPCLFLIERSRAPTCTMTCYSLVKQVSDC